MVRKVDCASASSLHQPLQLLSALRVLENLLLERDYLRCERLVHLLLGLLLILELLQLNQKFSLRVLLRRRTGIYCLSQQQVVCVHVVQLALHSFETVLEVLASVALILVHLLQVATLCCYSRGSSWTLLLLGWFWLLLLSGGLFLFYLHLLLLDDRFALLRHNGLDLLLSLVDLGNLCWRLLNVYHAVHRHGNVFLLDQHRLSSG